MDAKEVKPETLHARYEGGWYFCWLIERRDTPEPQWFGADCLWHKDANDAEWFARKSDAETSAAECPHDVVVCEHGFDLGESRARTSHDALVSQNKALRAACDAAMQCIGELSPTQARVEVAQMLQAALARSE